MAQSISQLIASFQAGGTFGIPACIVGSLEIAQLGYTCYSNREVSHRVSEKACTVNAIRIYYLFYTVSSSCTQYIPLYYLIYQEKIPYVSGKITCHR